MTRNGKIARLPNAVREQINRRLQDGDEGKQIAAWLNALPEAKAMLEGEFGGQPINETNLSNWKTGGYKDWQAQQEALEAVRSLGANASELCQATGGQLADQMATCLTARIAVALQRFSPDGDDPVAQAQHLRQLCSDRVALRKGDHDAQWLRLEREKLDLDLKKYEEQAAARKREFEEAHREPRPGGISQEALRTMEEKMKLL
jgi:hypothetical protein